MCGHVIRETVWDIKLSHSYKTLGRSGLVGVYVQKKLIGLDEIFREIRVWNQVGENDGGFQQCCMLGRHQIRFGVKKLEKNQNIQQNVNEKFNLIHISVSSSVLHKIKKNNNNHFIIHVDS